MTYSIVYSSRSGNTRMLADCIRTALPEDSCVFFGAPAEAGTQAGNADLIFAGFWTDKGSCPEEMKTFLQNQSGRKTFLFGTAGFGGSEVYFSRILKNVGQHLDSSCELAGTYMCQGKMPAAVRKRYEGMLEHGTDPDKVRGMIENFDRALGHPNEKDLRELERRVLEVWGQAG